MTDLPELMESLGLTPAPLLLLDDLTPGQLDRLANRIEQKALDAYPEKIEEYAFETLALIDQCAGRQDRRDLLRLHLVVPVVSAWQAAARTDKAVHWILLPMTDAYTEKPEVELDFERPLRLLPLGPVAALSVFDWLGQLCYVGWNASYFTDEITALVSRLGPFAVAMPDVLFARVATAMCHLAQWSNHHMAHLTPKLVERLAQLYTGADLQAHERAAVGLQVALLASHLGAAKHVIAADVLREVRDIPAELHLQLMMAAVDPDRDAEESAEDLIPVILSWRAKLDDEMDSLAANFITGRQFGVILPLLDALLSVGHLEAAMKMLGAWHGVPPEGCALTAVVAARREVDTNDWYWPGGHCRTEPHGSSLDVAVNRALGLALVDPANPSAVQLPERDQPDRAAAEELDRRLELIQPGEVPVAPEAPEGLLVNMVHPRIPLAHVLAEISNVVLPTAFSFQRPHPDRPVKRAAVFIGDSYTAEKEGQYVRCLLESGGVSVDLYADVDSNFDAFSEVHDATVHDLIWVAGHGEDGGWAPADAGFRLRESEWVSLQRVARLAPPDDGLRRLLVFNTCDSSAAAGLGGPSRVGTGALLACRSQAVIGHLWPVGMAVAPHFAARLAIGVVDSETFLDAYQFSLSMDADYLEARLLDSGVDHEDVERLRQVQPDHLLDRASTVFMV
jgi:hypothetical protein